MTKLTLLLALILSLSLLAGVACGGSSASPTRTSTPPTLTPTTSHLTPTPTPSPTSKPTVTPGGTPSAYLTYTDSANGIVVDYPSIWEQDDDLLTTPIDSTGVIAFRSSTEENSFRSYMIVTKRSLPISLDVRTVFQYAHSTGHQAAEFPDYVSISDGDITLGGLAAILHVFTFTDGDLKLKAKQLWVVKDAQAWVVRCVTAEASFSAAEPTLDSIVLSFSV